MENVKVEPVRHAKKKVNAPIQDLIGVTGYKSSIALLISSSFTEM